MKNWVKIIFMLFCFNAIAQTGVTVTYYDGGTQQFNVTTSGKLFFSADNLQIKQDSSSSITSIPVSIIRKIVFSEALGTTVIGENKKELSIYPNPSSDVIRINSNSNESMNLKIYSLSGQLLRSGEFEPNQAIDVSDFSKGIYLVQVDDVTLKFVKK
ncbi:T9SS type A sorting domain-containing protein [Flavobacterium sp.]|uniref:T9SS type A sorting domain-containing protein n=1 Tax=Flavobacterium sp. TaxID=239 RepID=UPI0035AFA8AC